MMAMTADGKIATSAREAARFGSGEDKRRLEDQVAWADALVIAAGTIRAYGTTYRVARPDLARRRHADAVAEQPTTVVVTNSLDLSTELPFFTRQEVPRIIATLARNESAARNAFGRLADIVVAGDNAVDPAALYARLDRLGMRKVLALGGGRLNFDLVAAGVVDEIHMTVSPMLFGGSDAPTPMDGPGFPLADARRLHLVGSDAVGDEVFLRYDVAHEV